MSSRSLKAAVASAVLLLLSARADAESLAHATRVYPDEAISLAVHRRLAADPAVTSFLIDVDTQGGVVTLTGQAQHLRARNAALQIARSVRGVRGVVDRIRMVVPRRPDDTIRADVLQVLTLNPTLHRYGLRAEVRDGVVTLHGPVPGRRARALVLDTVSGIKGITALEDRMTLLESQTFRFDEETRRDIAHTFRLSGWLNDALVEVDVKKGRVLLSGSVGSAVEKQRAAELAWVEGVREVDASRLEVDFGWGAELQRRHPVAEPTAEELTDFLHVSFQRDPRLAPYELQATVAGGLARVMGVVDNAQARLAAEEVARNTPGIWRVENSVTLQPARRVTDAELRTRLERAMAFQPYVDPTEVSWSLYDGIVTLTGEVDSQFEREEAERAAADINGVVGIHNALKISESWSSEADVRIRENVESALQWSPFTDTSAVEVNVQYGVVTLTGRVDGWMAWREAQEHALRCGAKGLHNELVVGKRGRGGI
ncbi:MAG: BON domain-containing protein [Myxococcota bacterium]